MHYRIFLTIGLLIAQTWASAQTADPPSRLALDQARAQRSKAKTMKAQAKKTYEADVKVCQSKAIAIGCMSSAKERRSETLKQADALEREGRTTEREANRREIEAKAAKRETEEQGRQADVERYRETEADRAAEREQRQTKEAARLESRRNKVAAEKAARERKLEERKKRDARQAAAAAERARKKAEMEQQQEERVRKIDERKRKYAEQEKRREAKQAAPAK